MVADIINLVSQILVKTIFSFSFFFVASKSDFVQTKFCMSVYKDILLTEPCNSHDLYICMDRNECFYALLNISFFPLRYEVLSSQQQYAANLTFKSYFNLIVKFKLITNFKVDR